jgi:hypothetical protein
MCEYGKQTQNCDTKAESLGSIHERERLRVLGETGADQALLA